MEKGIQNKLDHVVASTPSKCMIKYWPCNLTNAGAPDYYRALLACEKCGNSVKSSYQFEPYIKACMRLLKDVDRATVRTVESFARDSDEVHMIVKF